MGESMGWRGLETLLGPYGYFGDAESTKKVSRKRSRVTRPCVGIERRQVLSIRVMESFIFYRFKLIELNGHNICQLLL